MGSQSVSVVHEPLHTFSQAALQTGFCTGDQTMKFCTVIVLLISLVILDVVGQLNFNNGGGGGRRQQGNNRRRPGNGDRRPNGGGVSFGQNSFSQGGSSKNPSIKDFLGNNAPKTNNINTRGFGVSTRRQGDQCTTPLGRRGKCAYIFEPRCSSVLNVILQNGINQNVINYLIQAIRSPCGFESFDFTLCCEDASQPFQTTPTTQRTTTTRRTTTTTRRPIQSSQCGRPDFSQRIVGGTEARQGAWPWAVILGRSSFGRFQVMCGGTLLDEDTILTAAHCFDQSGINMVRLGDHDITTNSDGATPVDVSVGRTIVHPGWDSNTLDNDIAIVKLSRSVSYSRNIKPACLPDSYRGRDLASLLVRPDPVIVGWGSTVSGGGSQDRLRQANVPMVTQQSCASSYSSISRVTIGANKLCAGKGKIDTCNGDSGGALLANQIGGAYSVVGITSFGVDCARPGYPGVYTRVDRYLDWIRREM